MKFVVTVLGGHEKGFNGITPFEVHLDTQAVACRFEPFSKSVYVWYHHGNIFAVLSIVIGVVELVSSGCLSIMGVAFTVECVFRLSRAHGAKLQAYRAFLMCSISLCSAC